MVMLARFPGEHHVIASSSDARAAKDNLNVANAAEASNFNQSIME
jgi:hypothetical protein